MKNILAKLALYKVAFLLLLISTFSTAQNCKHYSPFSDVIDKSPAEAKSIFESNAATTYFKYSGKSGNTYYFKPSYRTEYNPIKIECITSTSGKINEVRLIYESHKKTDVIKGFTNRGWTHFTNTNTLRCESKERQLNYWIIGNQFTLRIQYFDPPKNNDGSLQSSRVYICGGPYSEKFHSNTQCTGLNNCQGGKTWINTPKDAMDKGYRHCNVCWDK